jgi:hypothetical protein
MRTVLYADDLYQGKRLFDALKQCDLNGALEYHRSIRSLREQVCSAAMYGSIYVLMPSSRNHLLSLKQLSDFFVNTKIILVLPDRSRKTVSLGHSFYPRFISYIDNNNENIRVVLENIYKKANRSPPEFE